MNQTCKHGKSIPARDCEYCAKDRELYIPKSEVRAMIEEYFKERQQETLNQDFGSSAFGLITKEGIMKLINQYSSDLSNKLEETE